MTDFPEFNSFFMAGFECSSHRRKDGVRLDLIRATSHDVHALDDYRGCAELGLTGVRDGLRWHLIGANARAFDWTSWRPMLHAAAEAGMQVLWDLFHYGWPDRLDPLSDDFPQAFAAFAAEAVRVHRTETGKAAIVCPVNEISFFSWAINEGYFAYPVRPAKGVFKRQLIRCAVAAGAAMREADPGVRFVWAEPLIHVAAGTGEYADPVEAENYRRSQFEAYDLLMGRLEPELGGSPSMVDAIGLNFYPLNQWHLGGCTIPLGDHEYKPLSTMLIEVQERYGKPIFISETGAEGSSRTAWLHYVCDEVRDALDRGADIRGLCIYPVAAYPGWDDSRHSEVGLFSAPEADGRRRLFEPMVAELKRQQAIFSSRSEVRR